MTVIERLNLRGEGVAPGLIVARALPGEAVGGEALDGRIAQPKILTPSPDRVAAPCRHYKACGGCALQHASDAFVQDWKTGVVRQALAGQGLEAPFRQALTSPAGTRRRATLAGRRLKSGALVGFHGRASDTVTAIPGCTLLDPALVAVIPALEALVTEGGSRKGEVRLTVTRYTEGVEVSVEEGKPLDRDLRVSLPQIAGAHRLARLVWNGEVLLQEAPPSLTMGRARVSPPPGAFLQATPQGEAALKAAVVEAVGSAKQVVDLFAGCGTFALPLAETAEVHAVEGAAPMLAALDLGWRNATGLKRVTTEARDLFRRPLMPDELKRFDAAVIDPPRAGAEAQVAELAQAAVPVIAHVSCNPVTFARDARALVGAGYRLDWVQVVDQFRWSAHVELVARFSRAHMA
ncbi:class I SAM-dependent RNA methyltransferase [Pararhodobacter aggregans]|uniref:Class I SAM-dependent RNA methyltransferase n=1 Tax=Pararhodobacter aggregans TaxID=404875 RepID=A0A2T7UTU0_9RHOB|nr:class I SAM-dependent RNA methyltransferase [Pararhodobacter aggregans]PTX02981.1 23S rRNA m(5)U-1939 methyltransferase [Pararhodobacter aggregans]PVE48190.1 class I SAM-dependent RNA methyltransferase [Pararhodobacter aggregans]